MYICKVVAIKDMSAGNESVGEMWKETKIFESTATLADVLEWGDENCLNNGISSRRNIIITKPSEDI